jgi:MFS family permease
MPDILTPETAAADAAETVAAASSVLRNRDFLLLWLSQLFSQIGQNALVLGILVMIQRLTQSPTHLSVATLSLILPSVLFSMLAGVMVDRLNKKGVLVVTNMLRVVASLAYLFLDRSVALIYVVSFLFSSVGQFFGPAEASAIPALVRFEQLITANSLFNLTLSASQLLGLVIFAPLLIKIVGISGFFVALALLFAVATMCVALLPANRLGVTSMSGEDSTRLIRGVWVDLREGWRILSGDELASMAMLYLTLMASFIPLLAALGPSFAVQVIHAGAEDVVYLFAPAGVSMVLTTLVVGKLAARVGKLRLMATSLVALGLTLGLLALAKTGGSYLLYNLIGRVMDTRHLVLELIPIVMLLSFAIGIEFVCISIPAQTLLQERCPARFRGRIFGVQFTLSGAASLIPLLGAGSFADLFGVNKAIFALGAILLVIGGFLLRNLGSGVAAGPGE